ncbi:MULTISPECIES: histidine kinase [Sphingobacterium]|uniref:histidine kinase n=1 Tax=Sphingobacterium TaxID=28453 RepID=UPI0028ACD08B|nr:histidine kinase [Sphingobacterium multivorum]
MKRKFYKMIKAAFPPVNMRFRDFNVENRPIFEVNPKDFLTHLLAVLGVIFIEMLPLIFSDEDVDYTKFIPFYIFDITFFFLVFYFYFPLVLALFTKSAQRFLAALGAVLGFGVFLHLYESLIRYFKSGIWEIEWTLKSFQLSGARATFISLIAYLLARNKYVIQVEREIGRRKTRELELKNDLLRAQLDPHLINNVLSVLYIRIIEYSQVDAEIVRLLAGLSSHSISQSDEKGYISLKAELNNIKDSIKVFELCREKSCKVAWNIGLDNTGDITIPPKLLIEPVMNSLKYGLNDGQIEIDLQLRPDHTLLFRTFNYKALEVGNHSSHELGLNNLKERLQINYPEKHTLTIQETATTFELTLIISL